MSYISFVLPSTLGPWITPTALAFSAALLLPAWLAHSSQPETGALQPITPLIELAKADTLIVYAAPADADPVLRISTRDDHGNWQESQLQLSQENPVQSAKLVEAVIARETGNLTNQP